jgi:hypothetical protein
MQAKVRDAAQDAALLRARLARLRALRAALACPHSLAAQAVAAYTALVDEAVRDVAVAAHRERYGGRRPQQPAAGDGHRVRFWMRVRVCEQCVHCLY